MSDTAALELAKSALELAIEQTQGSQDRRYFSQEERDNMDSEDFAGPHESFPIKSQQDVYNAAKLVGHADDPAAVKSRIKSIAKKKGFKLPDSWESESSDNKDEKERAMDSEDMKKDAPASSNENVEAASDVSKANDAMDHEPYDGSHSHLHAHNSLDRADNKVTHSHSHPHSNDSKHSHSHEGMGRSYEVVDEQQRSSTIETSYRPSIYAPIMRIDSTKREVIGQATAEIPDSYGTIFAYYPKAWELWRGNIREQHDPKKAVGARIKHIPHDDTKSVDLHSRVSRGANDTWMKVEDNVLTGYSLSVIPDPEFGNNVANWPKKEYEGKMYPYLPRYSIAEVSLVDNPSCPNCNIAIVRADGFVTEEIDTDEEEVTTKVVEEQKTLERAGAKFSAESRNKLHAAIKSLQDTCGCPECSYEGSPADESADKEAVENAERIIASTLERMLLPVYARFQSIAGTLSRTSNSNIEQVVESQITRAIEAVDEKLNALVDKTSFDILRAEMSAVKDRVVQIAEQPMPGGPVLNANAVDKRLPTDSPYQITQEQPSYGAVYDAISNLSKRGQLDTPDKQVEAMTAALRAQRNGR